MRKKNIKEVAQNYSLVPQSKDAENRTPDEQAADIARDFNEEEGDNVNANALIKSKQNLEEGDKVISVKQLREMALLTKYNGVALTSVGNILKEYNKKVGNDINISNQVKDAINKGYTNSKSIVDYILKNSDGKTLQDRFGNEYKAEDFSDKESTQINRGVLFLNKGSKTQRISTQHLFVKSAPTSTTNIIFEDYYPPIWQEYAKQYIKNPNTVGNIFLEKLMEENDYKDYYDFIRESVRKENGNEIIIGKHNEGLLGGEERLVTDFFENLSRSLTKNKIEVLLDNGKIKTLCQFIKNANTTNSDFANSFEDNSIYSCAKKIYDIIADYNNPDYEKYLEMLNTRTINQGSGKPGEHSNLSQKDINSISSLQWLGLLVRQIKAFIGAYANKYSKERDIYAKIAKAINDEMGDNTITQDDVKQTAFDNSREDFKNLKEGSLLSLIAQTYNRGVKKFIDRYENNENNLMQDIKNNQDINIDNAITSIKTIEPILSKTLYGEKLIEILGKVHDLGGLKNNKPSGRESITRRAFREINENKKYIINETQLKELIKAGLI